MVWDAPTGAVRASFWRATVDEVRFVPNRFGCAVFSVGFVLAIWAITTIRRAGTRVETNKPTTAWILATLAPFYLGIRFSVIACRSFRAVVLRRLGAHSRSAGTRW